ncbi:hypothetical protein [Pyrobaculum aerophilum]|uniref:Uncharacterized protein n=1 Tax=Pyrobaculum aerophilum TaxID=13773 RepID=A0A371QX63_9CREN|nr:hypothetical protein [Pyrobaculum aerophilum]RFA95033.1 hypothetical protein CGL51_08600 [Pyrobaculum aerophilum]RFA96745.1 hypothetical protein CGL52_10630 [Pyrobaculum aerophilum]
MPLPKSLEWVVEEKQQEGERQETRQEVKPVDDWAHLLVSAISKMPQELATKLISCIPRETAVEILQRINDPYVKFALLLLTKQ